MLSRRKNKIAAVSIKGEEMVRASGDFGDGRDRRSNRTRWLNFCKGIWGCIHNYMNERIQLIDSKVSEEIVEKLGNSCDNSEMR